MSLEKRFLNLKRFAIGTLAGLTLFATASVKPLHAASVGSPETVGKGKFAVGAEYEQVFNRDMRLKSGDLGAGEEVRNAEIDSLYRVMAKPTYGLLDNLDIYAKIGTADFKGKEDGYADGAYEGTGKWNTKNAFAYGLGMKGNLEFSEGWLLGCDVQYVRHRNKETYKWIDASGMEESESGRRTIQEWHVAPFVAKRLGNFTPYGGVKYSDLRDTEKIADGTWKYKADDNFGMFVGTDYKVGKNLSLNVEGRFIDETAMSVGATYKF